MDKFDVTRLDRDGYDWDVPLDLARLQRTVQEFIALIQNNEMTCQDDQVILDKFCAFVNKPEVWPLAQMVVPEFRCAREDRDADAGQKTTSLDYVLDRLSGLPPRRNDKSILTSEQDLLNQRHKQWVEYVVTGGRGREAATSAERDEVKERVSQVEKVISDFHIEHPTLYTPRNSERKPRGHRNKADDSDDGDAGDAGEASEGGGSRERAPRYIDLENYGLD